MLNLLLGMWSLISLSHQGRRDLAITGHYDHSKSQVTPQDKGENSIF
jgi:hypothetical protein